jgi:hypothetical protein
MHSSERTSVLADLAAVGRLDRAIRERRKQVTDKETLDLLDALSGVPPFDEVTVRAQVERADDRQMLTRIVLALDRAGQFAPAAPLLAAARIAISSIDAAQRIEAERLFPFFGRKEAIASVHRLISLKTASPKGCVFVTGLPGIGKSALLAHSISSHPERHLRLLLRLDFDRAGLDVEDQLGLTLEAARQLAEQLGAAGASLIGARTDALEAAAPRLSDAFSVTEAPAGLEMTPRELIEGIRDAVRASGRSLIVLLDTLEVLRGRGESQPDTLFKWLDQISRGGELPTAVVAAGRGDALDGCRGRIAEEIVLAGLPAEDARQLLKRLELPAALHGTALEIGDGIPLRLRLAAEILRRSDRSEVARKFGRRKVDAAFLYRFLLSRIDDPLLKALANPGLIVRRVNAALLSEVIAPALGMPSLSRERAEEALRHLRTHHWLVSPHADPLAPGFVQHRPDMRALLLPLLYRSAPRKAERINRAAAAWFARLGPGWPQVEAAYHGLQLMRHEGQPPPVQWEAAVQLDQDSLLELPTPARDHVLSLSGRRTSVGRVGTSSDLDAVAREMVSIISRGDWNEAAFMARKVMDEGGFAPTSEVADAVCAYLWRSGRWSEAFTWLRHRDQVRDDDGDLVDMPPPVALARLEMRAETSPSRLLRALRQAGLDRSSLAEAALRGSDNLARHGAMALLTAGTNQALPHRKSTEEDADLAAAALAAFAGGPAAGDLRNAQMLGTRRLAVVTGAPNAASDAIPLEQALATLTPYSAPFSALVEWGDRSDLVARARETAERLLLSGELLPGLHQGQPADLQVRQPITAIVDMGLFAEWLSVIPIFSRDPSLRALSRSAERWRRAMAGSWGYSVRRRGWSNVDATLLTRSERLLGAGDVHNAAVRHVALWAGAWSAPRRSRSPEDVLAAYLARYSDRLDHGSSSLEARIALLSRWRVPSALIPAVAAASIAS